MANFFKTRFNVETKRLPTLEPVLFRPGDVISTNDLPEHDVERLVKNGTLLPLSPDEAKRDAARAQSWHDSLQLRKSKGLHVDPQQFEQVERDLKSKTAVAKAIG